MEPHAAVPSAPAGKARVVAALRRPQNWVQLVQFCAIGGVGAGINLAVYTALVHGADVHYLLAATVSFVVAVTNNYLLNRWWTFRRHRGSVASQGARFLVVSLVALGANLLIVLLLVEAAGLPKVPAQVLAIVLVTPVNFVGNKLWSFRRR